MMTGIDDPTQKRNNVHMSERTQRPRQGVQLQFLPSCTARVAFALGPSALNLKI